MFRNVSTPALAQTEQPDRPGSCVTKIHRDSCLFRGARQVEGASGESPSWTGSYRTRSQRGVACAPAPARGRAISRQDQSGNRKNAPARSRFHVARRSQWVSGTCSCRPRRFASPRRERKAVRGRFTRWGWLRSVTGAPGCRTSVARRSMSPMLTALGVRGYAWCDAPGGPAPNVALGSRLTNVTASCRLMQWRYSDPHFIERPAALWRPPTPSRDSFCRSTFCGVLGISA